MGVLVNTVLDAFLKMSIGLCECVFVLDRLHSVTGRALGMIVISLPLSLNLTSISANNSDDLFISAFFPTETESIAVARALVRYFTWAVGQGVTAISRTPALGWKKSWITGSNCLITIITLYCRV